jgi:hypothetical protein
MSIYNASAFQDQDENAFQDQAPSDENAFQDLGPSDAQVAADEQLAMANALEQDSDERWTQQSSSHSEWLAAGYDIA